MRISIIIVGLFCITRIFGQITQKSEYGNFLLKNATIVSVTNGTFTGDVLIEDGLISKIGTSLSSNNVHQSIDCTGKFIYPGLIDGGSILGLTEVGSVSLTQDFNELGDFNPHMKALTAVNPNASAIPVTRTSGVLTTLVIPKGGLISGKAALIHLVGYTPNQMDAGFEALALNYPSTAKRGRRDRRSPEDIKKEEEKAIKKLNEIWDNALMYSSIKEKKKAIKPGDKDYQPKYEAMEKAVKGEMNVLIEVNKDKDILSAIKWIKQKKIKAILTGVTEGWRVADSIASAGIPIITGPVLSIPSRTSDRYDVAYANAGKMAKAGVKVVLRTNESANVRNLPFHAGFAAAYGMGKDDALKAITINAAEIFGLGDYLGSIEQGKIANIFVSTGDPFETSTQIEYIFINGWKIALENRQTQFYNEFLKREPGLSKLPK